MVFKRRDRPPFWNRIREALYPRRGWRGWRRAIEYVAHRLRRLPDSPHKIALGIACGIFASFSPFFGLHPILAGVIAWGLRANIIAAVIATLAGNTLTTPFIASIAVPLGRQMLGRNGETGEPTRIVAILTDGAFSLWHNIMSLFTAGDPEWGNLVVLWHDLVVPYFVGGIPTGLLAGAVGYFVSRPLIAAYQERRRARLAARAITRASELRSKADGGA